ncbi:hypothetical protein [Hymenobacter busanensis]|uniref:hypothetical protein n=1 Tax=Hymenobacter busanensis TaxID=2607656 RepID=UPI001366D1A0|nr:hypothetical protein [Hymenobacter busanensis]QHJ09529.1 hypothetical protein GUY19_20535 [Hymenobacter busanensis]
MPSPKVPRYSRDEFLVLLDQRLRQLESQQEAQRQYSTLLTALRGQFESYLKEKTR